MATEETGETANKDSGKARERRRSRRFECDITAEAVVAQRGSMFRGEIRDLSRTGCFIQTKALLQLELLTVVDLHFGAKEGHIHVSSRVKTVRPGRGVGLEFQSVDLKTLNGINLMLKQLEAQEQQKQFKRIQAR